MYLTRSEINTQRRQSRRMLALPQRIHAAVLHGSPNHSSTQAECCGVSTTVTMTVWNC
jgi:CRISPR associated protein